MARAKPATIMKDGTETLPEVNLEVGMNFEQWAHDRAGFHTSTDMVTGGVSAQFGAYAGPEVGWNYQDGLGEERMEPTFVSKNAMHEVANPPGRMAAESAVQPGEFQRPGKTGFGKATLRGPQNYRLFGKDFS